MRVIVLLLNLLFVFCSTSVVANNITIPYDDDLNIVIDGEFNQQEWRGAKQFALEYVVRPQNNLPAPVHTTVYVIEDGETLYVAFIAADPAPNQIRASYRDRDLIWGDDLVGIKLDTFNDARLAYQFFVNPFGIQSDGIQNEMTGNESDSWNAIWQSQGQITPTGYIVEMALPLSIMNFDESAGDKTWGAEFVRFYPREDEQRISHLTYDRDNACNLCQMGKVNGFAQATQGQNLAIVPTIVAAKGRSRDIEDNADKAWDYADNQALSLDVKWGVTPEVSLQATFNPDFSQVESDTGQLSVNSTFALFFPEKRPFFVENADYFSSNYNLVYTRNINAPDYGLKLTGRQAAHSLGVFFANDQSTNFLIPGNLRSSVASLTQSSHNFAARYRYDINTSLSIGSITTAREADEYHNYVNGVDVKYMPTTNDTIRVQYVRSDTQYPTDLYLDLCDNDCTDLSDINENVLRVLKQDSFSGKALRLQYARDTEDYFVRASHYRNGSDFRADLGFVSRADRNVTVLGGGIIWRYTDSWFNTFRISGDWDRHKNTRGELIEEESELHFRLEGKHNTRIDIGGVVRERVGVRQFVAAMGLSDLDPNSQAPQRWQNTMNIQSMLAISDKTTLFDEDFIRLVVSGKPTADLSLFQFIGQGKQIDFSNNRLGDELRSESRIKYDLGDHVRIGLEYEYQTLDAQGAKVYTATLLNTRLTYQIDAKQFVRVIVALSDIQRNPANYVDEVNAEYSDRGIQLLYSYKLNPLTKFFVGYSDAAYQDDAAQRFQSNEQSVFMKFSYAWLQ